MVLLGLGNQDNHSCYMMKGARSFSVGFVLLRKRINRAVMGNPQFVLRVEN